MRSGGGRAVPDAFHGRHNFAAKFLQRSPHRLLAPGRNRRARIIVSIDVTMEDRDARPVL
jgi:hypothetical protein